MLNSRLFKPVRFFRF